MEKVPSTVAKKNGSRKRTLVRRIMPAMMVALVLLAGIYIGICGYVADKLSRPERRALSGDPSTYGLKFENVQFSSAVDSIQLKGWYIDSPGTRTILMIHGREGIRDDPSLGLMEIAQALVAQGYDVLSFDLRAHGQSGGDRYAFGQWEVRDVAGALAYLKGRGVTEVGVVAISMGAATALLVAPDHPEIRAIVSDTAFADLPVLIDFLFPKVSGLPTFFQPGLLFMARSFYGIDLAGNRPEQALARLKDRPVLLIHSSVDDFVPVMHANRLQGAGKDNPNLEVWITSAPGHAQSFKNQPAEYTRKMASFFTEHWR